MPESVEAGFAAFCGVRGAAYVVGDFKGWSVLTIFEGIVRVMNGSSSSPDSSPESSESCFKDGLVGLTLN